jgi:hypothetical protein
MTASPKPQTWQCHSRIAAQGCWRPGGRAGDRSQRKIHHPRTVRLPCPLGRLHGGTLRQYGVTSIVRLENVAKALRLKSQDAPDLPRFFHPGGRLLISDSASEADIRQTVRSWLGSECRDSRLSVRRGSRVQSASGWRCLEHGLSTDPTEIDDTSRGSIRRAWITRLRAPQWRTKDWHGDEIFPQAVYPSRWHGRYVAGRLADGEGADLS